MLGLHAKCVKRAQQRKSRKFGQLRALVLRVRSGHNDFKNHRLPFRDERSLAARENRLHHIDHKTL